MSASTPISTGAGELRGILCDQLDRLLAEREAATLDALWPDLVGLGLPLAMVPEAAGGAGLGWADFAALARIGGSRALAEPVFETMLANRFLSEANLATSEAPLSLAPEAGEPVPWGRIADKVLAWESEGGLLCADGKAAQWTEGSNIAGDPRDRIDWTALPDNGCTRATHADGAWNARLAGALLRSAQIAGALQKALELCVDYASVREQFGRPIGKFQAVQQMIAQLAAEAAAAEAAVEGAAQDADRVDLLGAAHLIAAAKIRTAAGAGKGAALAHQVHGAMGFTEEYALGALTTRLWAWRDEMGSERVWSEWLGREALAAPEGLWRFVTET